MGNVNSDVLAALTTNFQAIFQQALGDKAKTLDDVKAIATVIPSTTESESLNWFGITPPMTEWKDSRRMNGLLPYTYTLKAKDWANGLTVDRNAILDDKLGLYPPRIRGMASAYYRAVIREVFGTQLDNAHTLNAYDSAVMCGDTRTLGKSANIDNYMAGNYSDSESEVRAGINDAKAAMQKYQDDWGEPLNLIPDTIICAPEMELLIRQALKPGVAGVERPEANVVKQVIVNPFLTQGTGKDWYMACTTEELKPLILIDRQGPQFAALDRMDDYAAFHQKQFEYGADARFITGFGDPRTLIMMHNT